MLQTNAQMQAPVAPVPAATTAGRLVPYRPPVTTGLLVVNTLVFVAMAAAGRSLSEPPSSLLLKWGANWGPLSLDGQPWRILTSNYVHIGIPHFAFNMWALWQLGWLTERIFGGWTYLLTYTACGIAGGLASLWWHPLVVGAGASGAIFGLVGALISALYLGRLPLPEAARKGLLKNLLIVVAVNLFLGASSHGIDNAAHLGGLAMGLGLGAALAHGLTNPERRQEYERLIFIAAALLLVGFGSFVRHRNGYVVLVTPARSMIAVPRTRVGPDETAADRRGHRVTSQGCRAGSQERQDVERTRPGLPAGGTKRGGWRCFAKSSATRQVG